ncbi:carboxypeptidase regulatory-like domain-containing protein, partial [Natrialba sp. SSL1]|uniref:carboxypeptidase regulatory-like domain-containing protein n=1 Tax=Natrialba sp. SSL1 TaxID=1869245 RepID=UPI0008F88AF7
DEGEIDITGLDVPAEVDDDETVEIDIDLENLGDEGAIQEVALYLNEDDEPVDTEVVDMAASGVDDPIDHPAETTITFELEASDLDGGDHTVTVETEDDDASDAFTVLASNFEVSNLDAPDEADRGEEITVSVDIANTGNVDDTQAVEYRFDDLGDALDAQNVTLDADEETTVSFDIDTENVTEGTYDHGVFTEDNEATATIDILEAFFSVDITDAPEELAPGETYNVSADVVNAGDAPDEQTIAYEVTEGETDVAVVDGDVDEEELREELADRGVDEVDLDELVDGADNLADTLQDELGDSYDVQTVNAADLVDEVDAYDVFVVNDFDGADVDVFLDELEDDQGVVYLDNWGSSSNAVSDLSDATDDPSSVEDSFSGSAPIMLDITDDHALFDGVAAAGETIELHDGSAADRAWFDGYSGESIADVGDTGPDGATVGVSEDDDHVLLAAFGRSSFISNADFSAESNAIMANAVEHVDDYAGTASATDHTSEFVSLEPNESTTVEFTNTLAEDDGELEWHHVVESEDDAATAPFTIDDGPNWNVKGTVAEAATDEPIENASVELEAGNETYTNVTDADGKYGLENVPAGEHNLTVDAENFAAHTETVEVPEDDVVTVDVGLEKLPGTISGDVTASDDDAPVENATIVAENDDGDVHEATTDENGSYELDGVSAGTYVVNVVDTPPGYELDEVVTVAPGEHVDGVDFVVDRTAGSIEGTVTNAAGVPIADANVVDADDGAFNVTTAEDGSYEIEDITPGTNALRAVADGYDDSNVEFVEVETGETTTANLTLGTYFEVDDLAAPDTAEKGEEITVNATVTNTGEQEDTRMVFYFPPGTDFGTDVIDYQPELSETVTLEGGESTTVEFTYEIGADDEPGEYEHGISADEVESTVITIEGDEDDGEPVFNVTGLDAPADAEPGENVTITATLENTGDDAGTQTVTYAFDDETVANETVSLDATESTALEFTTELPADEGTYEHAVSSENDSATAQTDVEEAGEPEPAYFEVTEHDAPESVDAGEELTVNATITNTGDETDQQDVFLFWDSAMSDLEDAESVADLREAGIDSMESIELEGGESETVALTHEVDAETEPGTYQYTVSTLQEMVDGEVTVESAAEAAFPADPGGFDGAPPGAALGANPFENGIANGVGLLG